MGISAVTPTELKIGDIITVQTDNGLLAHRLVGIDVEAQTVLLCGEWQRSCDVFTFA